MQSPLPIHIGVDFDNTIACYDGLFHRLAGEQRLIPPDLPVSKIAVRDHLRAAGLEPRWTALQGIAYGARMADADAFPGVAEFFALCAERDIRTSIISHRTRQPIVGGPCDLHAAARAWLQARAYPVSGIWFEETREAKIVRIIEVGCTHFIDDLPEVLDHPDFPAGVTRVLFDPSGHHSGPSVASWDVMSGRCGILSEA